MRSTWGKSPLIGDGRPARLRFVVAVLPEANRSLLAEQRKHSDLYLVHGVADGNSYTAKVFPWLHDAPQLLSASFVAIVDDDAFVSVARVISDLAVVAASGRQRVVYSAFEWFAYQRNTGQFDAWGGCAVPDG